jgi:hypothetical protein
LFNFFFPVLSTCHCINLKMHLLGSSTGDLKVVFSQEVHSFTHSITQ